MRQYFARCSGGPTTAWSSSVAGPVGAFVSAPADLARVTTRFACGAVDGEVVLRRHRRLLPVHERADPSVRQPLVSPDREVYVQAARRAGRASIFSVRAGRTRLPLPTSLALRRLSKKCHRISNAYPPHEAGFAGAPDAARRAPGPSALLACVLHEYACSGARRTGRIRTTWPPDLSAPFLDSLLELSAGAC